MIDCHVCGLPMTRQGEMDLNGEEWVAMLRVDGHFVILRESELPGAAVR